VARTIEAPGPAATPPSSSMALGLLRLARPKQWIKNVLVFAAPGAAGVLDERTALVDTLIAFACFCMAAAGTYFLNDVRDVEADRRHPTKRHRPVAAGSVPPSVAAILGVVLLVAAVGLALTVRWPLAATVAGYAVLTTSYSAVLKHVAVVDIVAVAAGFVLRAIAGAAATDVPISDWFFIVTSFGSLFMVTGKRGAEAVEIGDDASSVRPSLTSYTPGFVAYLRSVSSSAVLVAYCLWAFEKAAESGSDVPWYQLSIVPFVVGVLRYALVLDEGRGSAPEEIVLADRALQVVGAVWLVVFALGVSTA
jgi:decaprenyl-phosphate phosphoribosyltransferase